MSITPTEISFGKYKDRKAVYLENGSLIACFLPKDGGKMASLVDKRSKREILVQAKDDCYRPMEFGQAYVDAECSGFDDMFPTIDSGYYERHPWQGLYLADHGEVCGLPWECSLECGRLSMYVHGVRFPYRLSKTVFFKDDALYIEYCCENLSGFDMDIIWAAHIMINAEENGTILVPYANSTNATCVFSSDPNLARHGDILSWPEYKSDSDEKKRLDITTPYNPQGNNYKYYFKDKVPKGQCGYAYPDGTQLMVSFDHDQVPYLGIWVNEGSFKNYHSVTLEPCTGTFDRPDRARLHGQYSVLPAKKKIEWWLSFETNLRLKSQ